MQGDVKQDVIVHSSSLFLSVVAAMMMITQKKQHKSHPKHQMCFFLSLSVRSSLFLFFIYFYSLLFFLLYSLVQGHHRSNRNQVSANSRDTLDQKQINQLIASKQIDNSEFASFFLRLVFAANIELRKKSATEKRLNL